MSAAIQDRASESISLTSLPGLPRWVAWQTEDRKPGKPSTKVPYNPHTDRPAKADDARTWGNRDAAERRAALLPKPYGLGGVGIELGDLGDGLSLGGIDLDSCRSDDGALAPWAVDVVERCSSYTEVSPSQTGCKVFFLYRTADLVALRSAMGTQHSKVWQRAHSHDGAHPPAIELHYWQSILCMDRRASGRHTSGITVGGYRYVTLADPRIWPRIQGGR